jgi:5-methylcytosine-specific restriction endonuclease McrA
MTDKANIIKAICTSLSSGDLPSASDIVRQQYPFSTQYISARKFTDAQALQVFIRDGFIDRYSGNHLIFPPVLRVLSFVLPVEFPFHSNWKMTETHQSYWELFPTLDHIVPIARGGTAEDANLVSTSMLRNSAKSNWTLEELAWSLHPPGKIKEWDGMLSWFLSYAKENRNITKDKYISRWHNLAAKL